MLCIPGRHFGIFKDSIEMVKMKLTRKHQQACLSFVIQMPSNRQCVHDIPVSPIPRKDWSEYAKPDYEIVSGDFVSLVVPDVKKFKHIVERYKNLGPYVNFEADQNGQLKLSLLSDRVTLSTHFKDLQSKIGCYTHTSSAVKEWY